MLKTKTATPPPANVFDTLKLSEETGLIRTAVRRELLFAEAAGVITCARIGASRVLPVDRLDAFRGWLVRRGLLAGPEPVPAA